MLYFANPSHGPVDDAMTAGVIGCINTPRQNKIIPPGAAWMADNGRYGSEAVGDDSPGWPGDLRFIAWLNKLRPRQADCRFVVAPDQPYDMKRTLQLAGPWCYQIRRMGYPVALALQNGAEDMRLPWADFDVACLGGTVEWKLGVAASWLARMARDRGKPVHMLKANSFRRLAKAWGMGCDSADGTFLTWAPRHNLQRLRRMLDDLEYRGAQMVI